MPLASVDVRFRGAKRTWPEDGVRSAYDPRRTSPGSKSRSAAASLVPATVDGRKSLLIPDCFSLIRYPEIEALDVGTRRATLSRQSRTRTSATGSRYRSA